MPQPRSALKQPFNNSGEMPHCASNRNGKASGHGGYWLHLSCILNARFHLHHLAGKLKILS
jgi:hypothetical protein